MNGEGARSARARSFAPASGGTRVFFLERLTSAALVPLIAFLVGVAVALSPADPATILDVLRRPIVAVALLLFIVVIALHMQLGMRSIIEDYVHDPFWGSLCRAGNIIVVWTVAAASVIALLVLTIGG